MKYKNLLLALFSGFLLWLGWPTKPLGFLLHVAFVPLLILENNLRDSTTKKKALKYFGLVYLALLIWNVGTTWWVYNATAGGSIFAMTCNAFFMCAPWMCFWWTKKKCGSLAGYFSLPVYWIAFEVIHLNWSLTWPWLTLGNGFASLHQIVQWYEFTGHLGGTLWILVGNLLVFAVIREGSLNRAALAVFAFWFGIPVLLSLGMYYGYKDKGKDVEVVVVQPNIDPYEQKFEGGTSFIPYEEQVERMMRLSEKMITPATKFVAWPETALPSGYFEHELKEYDLIKHLLAFTKKHPQITLITGLDTYKIYDKDPSPTARFREDIGNFDVFNAAVKIDCTGNYQLYHKAKLVPGVEYIPPVIKSLAIDLGGTVGGLGLSEEREVFYNKDSVGAAPVICYESVYGEFVTGYVRKGADFIAIITNDGWWGNTPGHRQHLQYAKLRCIETRRSLARSANTGISGFINQRGDILETSSYWEENALRGNVKANDKLTFYAKYGDYIGFAACFFAVICLLMLLSNIFFKLKIGKAEYAELKS
jgi:apolipoprotein N-acyltransferase